MRKSFAAITALAIFLAPAVASADTLSDLQARLQSLLSQVAAVQAQIDTLQSQAASAAQAPGGSFAPYCLTLTNTLGVGSSDATTGGEVTKLQKFLAQTPALYPEGLVTGYFGSATARAVGRLQQAAGIVSSTSATSGTGTVGLATRLFLAKTCSDSSSASATSASTAAGASAQATISSITIDQASLISLSSTPTLTGKAQNVKTLSLTVDAGNTISYRNDSVPVMGGIWTVTTSVLPNGAYKVLARSAQGDALASGYLIVSASEDASTTPAVVSPAKPALPVVVLPTYSTEKPAVAVSANGSTRGAATIPGASALIGWNAQNVSTCSIASDHPTDLSGSIPTFSSGSPTGPLSQTTTFTVSCTGNDGTPAAGYVTVTVH